MERDFCEKHDIARVVRCPKCGAYMAVDEDGYFCTECDREDEWWTT